MTDTQVGSVLVFAPLIVWMTSPPSKKDHGHHGPVKEKFKPHLRLPEGVEETDKEAAKQPEAPEEYGGIAGEGIPHGEGDKGLRAAQEDSHEHQDKQKQGSDTPTSSDNQCVLLLPRLPEYDLTQHVSTSHLLFAVLSILVNSRCGTSSSSSLHVYSSTDCK